MNFLTKIIEYKKSEVEQQKTQFGKDLSALKELCLAMPPTISFIEKISKTSRLNKIALIAEVKKASPSKGLIRADFNPVEIAIDYQKAGASALSVLTDEKFFQGSIEYLKNIRKITDLPILRKDFIIDPFQIYQTRLMGADIMLLIASALSFDELKTFYAIAKEIKLEVLIEVHNEQELEKALQLNAKLIGVNNRNLETFEVDINNTINLIQDKNIQELFIISESGISSAKDAEFLRKNGVSGILVGESLMRKTDLKKAVKELLPD